MSVIANRGGPYSRPTITDISDYVNPKGEVIFDHPHNRRCERSAWPKITASTGDNAGNMRAATPVATAGSKRAYHMG